MCSLGSGCGQFSQTLVPHSPHSAALRKNLKSFDSNVYHPWGTTFIREAGSSGHLKLLSGGPHPGASLQRRPLQASATVPDSPSINAAFLGGSTQSWKYCPISTHRSLICGGKRVKAQELCREKGLQEELLLAF